MSKFAICTCNFSRRGEAIGQAFLLEFSKGQTNSSRSFPAQEMMRLISLSNFVLWGMCCLHRKWVQQRNDFIVFQFLIFSWSPTRCKWCVIDTAFLANSSASTYLVRVHYLHVPSSFESSFSSSEMVLWPKHHYFLVRFDSGSLTFCILYKTYLDSFHHTLVMENLSPIFMLLYLCRVVFGLEHCLLGELRHRLTLLMLLYLRRVVLGLEHCLLGELRHRLTLLMLLYLCRVVLGLEHCLLGELRHRLTLLMLLYLCRVVFGLEHCLLGELRHRLTLLMLLYLRRVVFGLEHCLLGELRHRLTLLMLLYLCRVVFGLEHCLLGELRHRLTLLMFCIFAG